MGILDWLFGGSDDETGSAVAQQVIDQRIEQVVQIVNPRLKLVPGYRRRLAPAVEKAVLYCRQVEAQIVPSLEMSAAAWSESPILRALFATADDVPAVFSRCTEIQEFFENSPCAENVWASLRFRRQEVEGFGPAIHDGTVHQDVARTCVSFVDKTVLQPRVSEQEARIEIRRRAFKYLVAQALGQIASVSTRRKDLIEQRTMLQARLSMLKAQQVGLESVLESGSGAIEKIDDLARKLSENERSLAECPAIGNTLDYVMKRVRSVLIHAADHLAVEQVSLRLDPMNVRLPAGGAAAATGIRLPEVVVRHEPRIHVLVGRFPRRELIRRESLFDEARRLLC